MTDRQLPTYGRRFGRWLVSSAMLTGALTSVLVGCEMRGATDYLISGNEAFQRNDYKQAESDYRNALRIESRSSTALNNLGVILNELGKYDEAQDFLDRAIRVDPKNAIAHYALAQALLKTGKIDRAIGEARRAIQLASDDMGGHRALAEASLLKGKQDKASDDLKTAVEEYHTILQADQDDDRAHQGLGEALLLQDDKDNALLEGKKAIDLNPDNMAAHKIVAKALRAQGKNAEALKELDSVLKKDAADQEAGRLKAEIAGG